MNKIVTISILKNELLINLYYILELTNKTYKFIYYNNILYFNYTYILLNQFVTIFSLFLFIIIFFKFLFYIVVAFLIFL